MKDLRGRFFFTIDPEFPYGKRWIVRIHNARNELKGIIICRSKIELLEVFDRILPEDDVGIEINFGKN